MGQLNLSTFLQLEHLLFQTQSCHHGKIVPNMAVLLEFPILVNQVPLATHQVATPSSAHQNWARPPKRIAPCSFSKIPTTTEPISFCIWPSLAVS